MNLATLTKNVKKNKPYEFSVGRKRFVIYEVDTPTKEEKEAIALGRKEFKEGETTSLKDLANELGFTS